MFDSSTPWTGSRQTPLLVGFSRQEYQSVLPFPSPGDLPGPGIKPMSAALADGFFTAEPLGKAPINGLPNMLPQSLSTIVNWDFYLQFSLWKSMFGLLTTIFKNCQNCKNVRIVYLNFDYDLFTRKSSRESNLGIPKNLLQVHFSKWVLVYHLKLSAFSELCQIFFWPGVRWVSILDEYLEKVPILLPRIYIALT